MIAALLAVFAGTSFAKLPSEWNDAVRGLAEKIAAAAAPAHSLALDAKNNSMLSAADASAVCAALAAELTRRHFTILPFASPSRADAKVKLSLGNGGDGFVWVAEVRRGTENEAQVIMVSPPVLADRSPGNFESSPGFLQRQVWQQPEKFLDFALLPAGHPGASHLVILEPDRLAFYAPGESQWQLQRAVHIPHVAPWPRDLVGHIDVPAGTVSLPGVNCEGDFERPETLQCTVAAKEKGLATPADAEHLEINGRDADFVALGKVCDALGSISLVTGAGDWTEPDELRAYDTEGSGGYPVDIDLTLSFAGPILAHFVSDDGKSARIVSRNLQTGMYEASIVSIICGD